MKNIETKSSEQDNIVESLRSKKILSDLNNYEREEGSGFYYKKEMEFNKEKYKLIGVGCRYKLLLSVYSIGIYCNYIPEELLINSTEKILSSNSKKILLLKIYRERDILTMTPFLKSEFKKRIDINKENTKIINNLMYLFWILKKPLNFNLFFFLTTKILYC